GAQGREECAGAGVVPALLVGPGGVGVVAVLGRDVVELARGEAAAEREEVLPARGRRQVDVAAAAGGQVVDVAQEGGDVVVYLVARQGDADRQRNAGVAPDGHADRRGPDGGGDAGGVVGGGRDGIGGHGDRVGGAAVDVGLDVGGDLVSVARPGAAEADPGAFARRDRD